MGGVDTKHDHLVGQLPIQLTSKLGRATIQAGEEWDEAANRRYTLAWFKESAILDVNYTRNRSMIPMQPQVKY